jgi:membrane-bound serine protease (ClpP class)
MGNLFLAYLLILIGLLLMVFELIFFTGGVLFVLALGSIIAGVAMTFASSAALGIVTLLVLIVVIPVLVSAMFQWGPKLSWSKGIFLSAPEDGQTFADSPGVRDLEQYRGRVGKTVSQLRPAGITEFDGKRVDTITEGLMVDEGQWVKCIEVKEGRVIVRPIDGPPDLSEMKI